MLPKQGHTGESLGEGGTNIKIFAAHILAQSAIWCRFSSSIRCWWILRSHEHIHSTVLLKCFPFISFKTGDVLFIIIIFNAHLSPLAAATASRSLLPAALLWTSFKSQCWCRWVPVYLWGDQNNDYVLLCRPAHEIITNHTPQSRRWAGGRERRVDTSETQGEVLKRKPAWRM